MFGTVLHEVRHFYVNYRCTTWDGHNLKNYVALSNHLYVSSYDMPVAVFYTMTKPYTWDDLESIFCSYPVKKVKNHIEINSKLII